jgi:hypothetical protein
MEAHSVVSELRAVTVYRAGAVCTRVAIVDDAAAAHDRLRVTGLPLALAAFSLRARIAGSDVVVLDVRPGFEVELGEEIDLATERTALDQARRERQRLQALVDRVERELGELRALQPRFREPPRREPPRSAPLSSMLALVDLVDRRLDAIAAKRRELQRELEDAEESERLHERRLAEASSAHRTERARVTRAAIVTLSAAPNTACELAIEYEVGGARWAPSYQLALAPDGRGGTLSMRASIVQRTGEDWNAIALALSTASLRRRTELPELRSLRIGRAQAEPKRAGWREPPPGLDALFADYDAAASLRPVVPPPSSGDARQNGGRARAEEVVRRSMVAPPPRQAPMPVPPPSAAPMPASPTMAFGAAPPAPQSMTRAGGVMPGALDEMARLPSSTLVADADLMLDEEQEMAEPAPAPAFAPSHDLLDYAGLRMQGPDAGASRGRLSPAPSWSLGVAIGVHVRVEIVAALIDRARREAESIVHVPLPRDFIAVAAQDRFDYRFEARAPADVPSTGTWVGVAVADCDLELRPRYVCVPAVESRVYRTLELHNRTATALLPGPVDVVREGQFLLTTQLPPIPPGADGRRIGLGVEESIKVARNTRYNETTAGLFGGSSALPHEISIELDNRLGVPAEIEVRERVPVVSADEKDLEVKEHEIEPMWTEVDTPIDGVLVHGLRRWRVTVPARQKAMLTAKYTIRMPGDRMLVGGNRRS